MYYIVCLPKGYQLKKHEKQTKVSKEQICVYSRDMRTWNLELDIFAFFVLKLSLKYWN